MSVPTKKTFNLVYCLDSIIYHILVSWVTPFKK